jgi:hypothetical protein
MMRMIPKALRRILMGAGLLVMAQSMAIGAQAPEKAKPMAPNYEIVDLQKSGLANIRDIDPRLVAIRAFSIYKGGIADEGLRREVISLTFSDSERQAHIIHAMHDLPDDSVRSYRYIAILVRDGELWRLKQARRQWTCQLGRGQQEWSGQLCR